GPVKNNLVSLHGTLIMAIPTKDDLVICSDKKFMITGTRNRVMEVVKITQIGSHAAFGLSGNPVFYHPHSGAELFNAKNVVERFYANKDLRLIDETWHEFVPTLQQEFKRFLSGLTFEQAPPSGPGSSNFLFHIPFWLRMENSVQQP